MTILVGYYGKNNFGDELILKQFLNENDGQFIIFSHGLNYSLDNKVKLVYFWKQKDKLYNLKIFISALLKSKKVLWVGGTCFTDEEGVGFFKYMMISKLFFRKFGYVNIGVNKINKLSNKFKTSILFNWASFLSFRDEFSKTEALSYIVKWKKRNYTVSEDLGEKFLESIKSKMFQKQDKSLLIAWRNLKSYNINEDLLINELVNFISNQSAIKNFFLINTDETLDKDISQKIYNLLLEKKVNVIYLPAIDLNKKIEIIAKSSFIITSRLHIGIAGAIFGVNTYVFNYSNKILYWQTERNEDNKKAYEIFESFTELREVDFDNKNY